VAYEVAQELGAPLDVVLVRKLGVPFQPEVAMGALGEGGVCVLQRRTIRRAGVGEAQLAAVKRREQAELRRRAERYRAGRPPIPLTGRTVLIVDDGIATGATVHAACDVVRAQGAARVVVAVPVVASSALRALRAVADDVECLVSSMMFGSIGSWYQDFSQTSDDEVLACLAHTAMPSPGDVDGTAPDEDVEVEAGTTVLAGRLRVPDAAQGAVVIAQGSSSARYSPRSCLVAGTLNRSGLGTLLLDLLTPGEELRETAVQDLDALAARLTAASQWLRARLATAGIGWFGTGSGGAAVLSAAAAPDADIAAVVVCGGRPDLVGERLMAVRAPTLLVVGGRDRVGLDRHREAQRWLRCMNRLAVVPGADDPFDDPAALGSSAELVAEWLTTHMTGAGRQHAQLR
jgi:predicted phosphoribosyltransferase/dienelactone hydrolase